MKEYLKKLDSDFSCWGIDVLPAEAVEVLKAVGPQGALAFLEKVVSLLKFASVTVSRRYAFRKVDISFQKQVPIYVEETIRVIAGACDAESAALERALPDYGLSFWWKL